MSKTKKATAELGEVLAALYDEAENLSADPKVVTKLATHALADLLVRVTPPTSSRPVAWNHDKRSGWLD